MHHPLESDNEDILQCSDYFSNGFGCVPKEKCASFSGNINIFQKDEDLKTIFREEIENTAECPKNGMVCCYNETILKDVEDFLVNVFSSNEYVLYRKTFDQYSVNLFKLPSINEVNLHICALCFLCRISK